MSAIARMCKALVISAIALLLYGCYADQRREIAACQQEAFEKFFDEHAVGVPNAASALEETETTHAYVGQCMTEKGYVEDWSDRRCESKLNGEVNPYCYAPSGRFAFVAHKIESMVEP